MKKTSIPTNKCDSDTGEGKAADQACGGSLGGRSKAVMAIKDEATAR